MGLLTGSLHLVVAAEAKSGGKVKSDSALKGVRGAFHSYLVFLLAQRGEMAEEASEAAFHTAVLALEACMKDVYTASLYEEEALQSLFYWLHSFLGHGEPEIRTKVYRIWKHLLTTFGEFSKAFFLMRNKDGSTVDLLSNGFDTIMTGTEQEFRKWHIDNLAKVEAFFGRVHETAIASKTKKSEKWRADAVKSMEESRKKKGQELLKRLEQRNQKNRGLQQKQLEASTRAQHLAENMAQDEWLEYAARPLSVRREWGQLRWGLVRGEGIGAWSEEDWAQKEVWQLDFRVGPNSMRKKIVRSLEDEDIEVGVSSSRPNA